jgi:hypothetical protein
VLEAPHRIAVELKKKTRNEEPRREPYFFSGYSEVCCFDIHRQRNDLDVWSEWQAFSGSWFRDASEFGEASRVVALDERQHY